jgi:hypothetical protein
MNAGKTEQASHKEAQKAQEQQLEEIHFVPLVPSCGYSFHYPRPSAA